MQLHSGRQDMRFQKGFTLVELVVTIMLSAMVIIGMVGIMTVCIKLYNKSVHNSQIQQNARLAAEYMMRDFRYARQVLAADKEYARIQDKTGSEVIYRIGTNHVLYRVRNGGANAVTDGKYEVVDLLFQWRNSNTMQISFAVRDPVTGYSFMIDTCIAPLNVSH